MSPLDALESDLDAVDPLRHCRHVPANACSLPLQRGDAMLQILDIVRQTVDLPVDPAQVDERQIVGLFAQGACL